MKEQLKLARHALISAVILVAIALNALTAAAQHDHHAMQMSGSDTLASAPMVPSRGVADSALVADSLLALCRARGRGSVDVYSTCIGDGIGALSSAGNIALAMGVLDRVVHR